MRVARLGTSALLVGMAAMLLRLIGTGDYLKYVKPITGMFLAVSAVLMIIAGVWSALPRRATGDRHDDHVPGIAWLLTLPVLVVCLVGPTSLGAFTASRNTGTPRPPGAYTNGYPPLPAGDPLALPLVEYAQRATYGGEASLEGRNFSMVGFVSPGPEPGTWYLTRLQFQCCAADAGAVKVLAVDADEVADDQWLRVTGGYLPAGTDGIAQLKVAAVEPVEPPDDPYAYG